MNIISANLFECQCNYNNSFVNMNKAFCFFLVHSLNSNPKFSEQHISLTHKLFFPDFLLVIMYTLEKNNRIYGYILC